MIKKSKQQFGVVHGVGINDANYPVSWGIKGSRKRCQIYTKWVAMFRRCYCHKFQLKSKTYIGCTVAPEWHSFMAFRSWAITQPWEGRHLDKDIRVIGNKIYGPDTCLFVTSAVNHLLNTNDAQRGDHPLGVWKNKNSFTAHCHFGGPSVHIGCFKTPQEAHAAWAQAKAAYIRKVADQQECQLTRQGLHAHADALVCEPFVTP